MTDTTAPTKTEPTVSDMRAWLKANGHPVGDRGRLSAEQRKAYNDAHGITD